MIHSKVIGRLLSFLVGLGFVCSLHAQNIQSVFEIIPERTRSSIDSDTLLYLPNISKTKKVVIEYNGFPKHVGVSLFSPEMKELTNKPICNFIERMLFLMATTPSISENISYLQRNKISFSLNNNAYGSTKFRNIKSLIDEIDAPSLFNIKNSSGGFIVTLQYGVFNEIEMKFPAQRELVYGTDKKESDAVVNDLLRSIPLNSRIINKPIDVADLAGQADGLLVKRGKSFQIPLLKNDIYVDAENNMPVFSAAFPEASLNNVMLGLVKTNARLEVKHRMYGSYTPDFIVGLNNLFDNFSKEYNLYTASQPLDDGRTQYVTIFHNHVYNYLHMLIITAKQSDFFAGNVILPADFYSNIPQHYIKSLF